MMKNKLVVIALSTLLMASGIAFADMDFRPYVGVEFDKNRYKGANEITTPQGTRIFRIDGKPLFGKSGSGITAFVGARFCDNVGIELGYTALSRIKYSGASPTILSGTTKTTNFYGDILGFVPVADQFELIGSIGVGVLSSKLSASYSTRQVGPGFVATRSESFSTDHSKAGIRIGAGGQYNFCDNWNARLMLRYQKGNQFIKNVSSLGLGLAYQFN